MIEIPINIYLKKKHMKPPCNMLHAQEHDHKKRFHLTNEKKILTDETINNIYSNCNTGKP